MRVTNGSTWNITDCSATAEYRGEMTTSNVTTWPLPRCSTPASGTSSVTASSARGRPARERAFGTGSRSSCKSKKHDGRKHGLRPFPQLRRGERPATRKDDSNEVEKEAAVL